jgi:hypothetical protein
MLRLPWLSLLCGVAICLSGCGETATTPLIDLPILAEDEVDAGILGVESALSLSMEDEWCSDPTAPYCGECSGDECWWGGEAYQCTPFQMWATPWVFGSFQYLDDSMIPFRWEINWGQLGSTAITGQARFHDILRGTVQPMFVWSPFRFVTGGGQIHARFRGIPFGSEIHGTICKAVQPV